MAGGCARGLVPTCAPAVPRSYYRGEDYFEVDVECTTTRAAAAVVNMVKGACKTLVIDLAFLIQGNTEAELPERTLLGVRFSRVNMDTLPLRPAVPPASACPRASRGHSPPAPSAGSGATP